MNERSAVLRAQSGDRAALDALLRDLIPPLLRYVRRIVGDDALAQDVTQDALVLIVRKLGWLTEPAFFRAWAYRIASRTAFRAIRKQKFESEEGLEFAGVEPPEIEPWQRERLASAIDRLSPASRAVITLHYLDEMSLAEIADILELSLGTVKSRLAYGLAQLRKEPL